MIRIPKRWQAAVTPSTDEAFTRDVRQRTDESAAVRINKRSGGRDESGDQFPAAAHDLTSPVAHDVSREGEHRSADVVRRTVESFAAALASRFEVGDRKKSRLACAWWRRLQRPGVIGGMIHSTSDFGTGWLTVRATADSVAGERAVLRVAHALVVVELQASRRGVNEFKH